MCYVAFDPSKEEELVFSEGSRIGSPAQAQYTLPDGTLLNLGPERFRAPEILFQPDIVGEEYPGIHECLVNSIHRSDMDLRLNLYQNIVLSGGSTLFKGISALPMRISPPSAPTSH